MAARRISHVCVLALLCGAAACSDSGETQDAGAGHDGPGAVGDGAQLPTPDGGAAPACDPGFGAAQACGGTLEGTWQYVDGCVPKETLDAIKKVCKGAQVGNVTSSASGSLSFTKSTYNLDANLLLTADYSITKVCAAVVGGCAKAATGVQLLVPGSKVSCTNSSAGCDCKISMTWSTRWLGAFSTAGNQVELKSGQRYHYCVKGTVLRYRGVAANTTDNVVTYVLTR